MTTLTNPNTPDVNNLIERCFVTSDLHIADGSALEQFYDDDAFSRWIDTIADPTTMLVLNGDVIDFAIIAPWKRPKTLPSHLLWTEAESVAKLQRCIDAHAVWFDSLATFHAAGGELVIVVGNHDLDWIWPDVQTAFATRIGAAETAEGFERLRFESLGTSFAGVWIEHGHRFTPENAPKHADDPSTWIHTYNGERYLERVWGTDVLVSFYNDKHDQYPYMSNIKPTWKMVLMGLKRGWFGWHDFVRAAAFLARRGVPGKALGSFVLSDDDVANSIDPNEITRLFQDKETQDAIEAALADLTWDEARKDPVSNLDESLLAALGEATGVAIQSDDFGFGSLVVPEDINQEGVSPTLGLFSESREVKAALEKLHAYDHVVFGHTHVVVDAHDLGHGKKMFNPGCWIEHLDMDNPRVKEVVEEHGVTAGLLNNKAGAGDPDGSGGYYTTDFFAVRILNDGTAPTLISVGAVLAALTGHLEQ